MFHFHDCRSLVQSHFHFQHTFLCSSKTCKYLNQTKRKDTVVALILYYQRREWSPSRSSPFDPHFIASSFTEDSAILYKWVVSDLSSLNTKHKSIISLSKTSTNILHHLRRPSPYQPFVMADRLQNLLAEERLNVEIYNILRPSVVKISHFLSSRMRPYGPRPDPPPSGTGFLWNQEGIIVTAYSVAKFACENRVNEDPVDICVTLFDGRVKIAHVVASSPHNDISVLQLQGEIPNLTPIRVGGVSVHDLLIGQQVFTVGHPFGLGQSFFVGIISGLNREILNNGSRIQQCIEVNCTINPGNGGGPLVDSSGRLISMIVSLHECSRIGYSIPIDTISRVVGQLLEQQET